MRIGGDCAGALTIGAYAEDESAFYEEISTESLKRIIVTEGTSGLIQSGHHSRLSLAGTQGKLPVRLKNEKLEMPHAGAASTHIIKFNRRSESYPRLVENEYFVTEVAKNMRLNSIIAHLKHVEDEKIFISKRYDRSEDEWPRKYHQEDFCQALGYSYQKKYEKEGGPNFSLCVSFAREHLNLLAVSTLLDWFLFNFMMGNSDADAKNISVLYSPGKNADLTPFYDFVCTRAYVNIDRSLAMAFGGEFDPDLVSAKHIDRLGKEISVSSRLIKSRFITMFKELPKAIEAAKITMQSEGIEENDLQFILQPLKKIHRTIEKNFAALLLR